MMFKKKYIILFVALFILITLSFIFKDYIRNEYSNIRLQAFDNVPENARLLVVCPHCDDETLGSFGLIKNVLKKNGQVLVLLLTNGDASTRGAKLCFDTEKPTHEDYIKLGFMRQKETIKAMQYAGVKKKDIIFLGYPDRGLEALWNVNWENDYPLDNYFTGTKYSPYNNSYSPKALYTGYNLSQDIIKIFDRFNPNIIVYPHPEDHHRDHRTAYAFIKYAILKSNLKMPKEYHYLVHYDEWPAPFGNHIYSQIKPPNSLTDTDYGWQAYYLPMNILYQKRSAIYEYKTQTKVMKNFLQSFIRKNELYGKYDNIEFSCDNDKVYTKKIIEKSADNITGIIVSPQANIQRISAKNNVNHISFRLETEGGISSDMIYSLDITAFAKNGTSYRMNISYEKGAGELHYISKPDVNLFDDISVDSKSNYVDIIIKKSDIKDIKAFLVGSKVIYGNKIIYSTGWRLITLK